MGTILEMPPPPETRAMAEARAARDREIGKRVCIALLSYEAGTTMATEERRWGDRTVGGFWITAGRVLREEYHAAKTAAAEPGAPDPDAS